MRFRFSIALIIFVLLLGHANPSHAFWWMIYHKPAFKGKVIEAETKEPIEGAVVAALYYKMSFLGIIESHSVIIHVRETLTDKNGTFHLPAYTTLIQPLSLEYMVDFIIFKPGYGVFPAYRTSPPIIGVNNMEVFFSKAETGTEGEIRRDAEMIKVTFGIVELPKLKTKEESLDETRAIVPAPVEIYAGPLSDISSSVERKGRT